MEDQYDNNNSSTLLFKIIDAKVDSYAIDLEKQIQKLPSTLKFIKKYLYYEFLPKIDKAINELEYMKETPNYDEKIANVRPLSIRNTDNLTCIDMLSNHNIKHPKITKIVYGTLTGNLCVYDIDNDKIVTEKNISKTNRIDSLATSTTKYYDTYLTRIAANCRSEINITVLSYNHSFSIMNTECVINTVSPGSADPITNAKISLGYLINTLTFSKDSFYLSAVDYAGGVRIYKFHDIPLINPSLTIDSTTNVNPTNINAPGIITGGKDNPKGNNNKIESNAKASQQSKENLISQVFLFVTHVKNKDHEDFTILPDTTKEENIPVKGGKKPQDLKQQTKGKGKDIKGAAKAEINEPVIIDETVYNIQSEFDSVSGDVSLFQKYAKNHPICHFIQKKFIFEEKYNSGYSASTITIGIYIAFLNSNNFKYVSLYPYLTDNMKTIFKVSKIKANTALTVEESMSLNSQMVKKEKEYLNFIRSKVDNTLNPVTSLILAQKEKEKETVVPAQKGKEKKDEKKDVKDQGIQSQGINTGVNKNLLEITKNEITFSTLFPITALTGQKQVNSVSNFLAIGMIDGSILVWDCELHCDKFLLQKNSRFEITAMCINDNYLTCGTKVGQIYIYELSTGTEIYTCYHNPYTADPLYHISSIFPLMILGIDDKDKLCLYNTKEKHKIAKIKLQEFEKKSSYTRIAYFNQYLINQNEEYLLFICEKVDQPPSKPSLIDLINFQKEREKLLLNKPHDSSTNFYNAPIERYECEENRLKIQRKTMNLYKIKDILFKCYPALIYSSKKGHSIKKIMKKYDSNSYPSPSFEKFAPDLNKDEFLINKTKSPSRLSPSKIFLEKKANESAMNVKMDLLADLTDKPNEGQKSNEEIPESKKTKQISTQKKDVFYNSFKCIRERYQYKDQRTNNIQLRNEKISKELAGGHHNKKK